MQHALVQITVEDFDTSYSGFETRGFPLRQRHGSKGSQVFQHTDDPTKVSILFTWENCEAMEGFLSDPDVRESMKRGGTDGPPTITFLEEPGTLGA